jgi:ribA/ribD-fused uncharacterized protein
MITILPHDTLGMHDAFPFVMNGIVYQSVYQRILCKQALLLDDVEAFRELRRLETSEEFIQRGKQLSRRYQREWDENVYNACLEAVRAKFKGPCKHEILVKGEFVYIVPDLFWGTAGTETAALIGLPYRGRNAYGEILTTVRDELMEAVYGKQD